MSDGWPERDWFEKADQDLEDLELARRALGPEEPLPGMACYHAQQCAEKYLKGYLIAHSVPFRFVPFGRTGNIAQIDQSRFRISPRGRHGQ